MGNMLEMSWTMRRPIHKVTDRNDERMNEVVLIIYNQTFSGIAH